MPWTGFLKLAPCRQSHVPSCCELIIGLTVKLVQGNQVYLEWIETLGSFGMVARPLEFLATFKLRCDGNPGIPFLTKQGKGPLSQDEEGKMRLFFSCGGTLSVPLEWKRVCWGLLELQQGFHGPFQCTRGKMGFLLRSRSRKGPHLALRGESPGFS